ncbi:MAG: hypothetical protein VKM17_07905 [Cyanobacteriota bacterium]|nr:hypothetical protein [Cyanobacteriota bacterium]
MQEKRKSLHRTLLWLAFPSVVGAYLLCSLISYGWPGTISTKGFELLGSGRMPGFDDIKWLLSFSACEGNLQELISKNATCFDYNNPGYPTLSMELGRWLGLGPSHAGWLGLIGGAGVTTVLAHAFWLCTGNIRSWSIITGILGLSYPYQLLVERGNLDSVILLLVALFCLIIWLPGAESILLANVVTAFAIALKIYPAILTAAWLVYSLKAPMESRRKRILNLSLLATTAAALLFTFTTIHGRMDSASGGLSSHGLTAIGYANMFLLREFGYTVGRIFIYSLYALKTLSILGGLWGGLDVRQESEVTQAFVEDVHQPPGFALHPHLCHDHISPRHGLLHHYYQL